MREIKQRAPDPEVDGRLVQGFFEQMETAMAKHPLWAGATPHDLDAATEVSGSFFWLLLLLCVAVAKPSPYNNQ